MSAPTPEMLSWQILAGAIVLLAMAVVFSIMALRRKRRLQRIIRYTEHDIRNTLNAIGARLTDEQRDQQLLAGLAYIERQLLNLVFWARAQRYQPVSFSLSKSLKDLKWLRTQAQAKGLDFEVEFIGDLPDMVYADPGKLGSVLANLAGNAIKATAKGKVVISAKRAGTNPYGFALVQFSVDDSGPGLTQAQLRQVLRGVRIHKQKRDRGFGMEIVQKWITAMGGRLEYERSPLGGSRFHFTIALQPEDSRAPTSVRVLIVDDDPGILKSLGQELMEIQVEPVLLESGSDAIEMLQRHRFDLVITDIQMPGMMGYEIAAALQDMAIEMPPIIAMTSSQLTEDLRQACLNAGIMRLLQKPLNGTRLRKLLLEELGALNVLVLDDDLMIASAITHAFEIAECNVVTVHTPKDAEVALRQQEFHVAILDNYLDGEKAGPELARLIRSEDSSNRIRLISHSGSGKLTAEEQDLYDAVVQKGLHSIQELRHKIALWYPARVLPGATKGELPVFEVANLQALADACYYDMDSVRARVPEYAEASKERLLVVADALKRVELESVVRATHNLIGPGSMFMNAQWTERIRELESELRVSSTGLSKEQEVRFTAILKECEAGIREVQGWLHNNREN